MNILQLQDNLKNFSQEQLIKEMQMPSGQVPQFLVLSELDRRKRVNEDFQAQQAANQPTVAQETVAAAGVPQGGVTDMARAMAPKTSMVENTGIGALMPKQPTRMADGGVVKMAKAGGVEGLVEPYPATSPNPRDRGVWMSKYGKTHNKDGTPKSFDSFVDDVGGIGSVNKDLDNYGLPNLKMQADAAIAAARGKDPQAVPTPDATALPQLISDAGFTAPSAPDFSAGFDFDATTPTSPLEAMTEANKGIARQDQPSYAGGDPKLRFSRGAGGFNEYSAPMVAVPEALFGDSYRTSSKLWPAGIASDDMNDLNYILGSPPKESIPSLDTSEPSAIDREVASASDYDEESGQYFSEMPLEALQIIANMGGKRGDNAAKAIANREDGAPEDGTTFGDKVRNSVIAIHDALRGTDLSTDIDPSKGPRAKLIAEINAIDEQIAAAQEAGKETLVTTLGNRRSALMNQLDLMEFKEDVGEGLRSLPNTAMDAANAVAGKLHDIDDATMKYYYQNIEGRFDPEGAAERLEKLEDKSKTIDKYYENKAAESEASKTVSSAREDAREQQIEDLRLEKDVTPPKGSQNVPIVPQEKSGLGIKSLTPPTSEDDKDGTVSDAKEKAETAAAAKSTTSTGGTGSGAKGTGSGAKGAGAAGGLEGQLAQMLKDMEKSREQDKWLAIAQIGAEMMKPTATFGEGIGNAISKGADTMREGKKQYGQDKLTILALQQKIDAAKLAAASRGSGSGSPKIPPATLLTAAQNEVNRLTTALGNATTQAERLALSEQLEVSTAQRDAIFSGITSYYPGLNVPSASTGSSRKKVN